MSLIVLVLTLMVCATEYSRRSYLWWFDALLFFGIGACAVIITAMIFSQHPTVKVNTQILIFNPLIVLFGIQAIRHNIRRAKNRFSTGAHWLWKALSIMAAVALLLCAVGVQWLDGSVITLAVALLCRYIIVTFPDFKPKRLES